MSLLRHCSVRTILATVFIVLAAGLCATLGWQLWGAWGLSDTAQRTAILAAADKAVFQATYDIRQQRTDLQTYFQSRNDFAQAVHETHEKAVKAYDLGVAAVEATPGIDAKTMLAPVRSTWSTYLTGNRELEDMVRAGKPKDVKALEPWYKAMTAVLDAHAKLSTDLSNAVRMTDPAMAEYVETRQLAFATRDTAGRECGTARPFIGRSQPLTPQAHDTIVDLRGRADATLSQLADVSSRPGMNPQISQLVSEVGGILSNGKVQRDAAYAKLDGSNKPLMPANEWTEACAKPMEKIYQVSWLSFDLMLAHIDSVQTAAAWRVRWIGAALAASIAFCVGGLLLINRRVARPVADLTRTIDRLAQRQYAAPVERSANQDEFGLMSERLEALRLSGVEAERLAADQIAGKDASLKKAATMQAECQKFETSISQMLNAVDAAGAQMTTVANAMAAAAQQTVGQSNAAATASEAASTNVRTVSTAADELAHSITEIGRQVGTAAKAATDAVQRAKSTSASIGRLSEAAQKIGDVVEMINAIAGQTNLLALNATIEAARAGEAGRGFAVVASEVKALAEQTAKATGEIGQQIAGIQAATQDSVNAIREISGTIERLSEISSTIAAAVEEQGAATQEISRNVQQAAQGTQQVSSNIIDVQRGAGETGSASSQVLSAAQSLSRDSNRLKLEVGEFLNTVRAA